MALIHRMVRSSGRLAMLAVRGMADVPAGSGSAVKLTFTSPGQVRKRTHSARHSDPTGPPARPDCWDGTSCYGSERRSAGGAA